MKVILAFALSILTCVSAASAGDWYASVYGGLNRNSIIDVPFVESQDGQVIGATIGKNLSIPGLRVEADASWRTNDVEIFGGAISADHETTALMFNVAYDIGSGPFKPYLMAGGGVAHTQATFENISLLTIEASDIAYQLGAGVNVAVAPGIRIGVGATWMQGPRVEIMGLELSNGENQSAHARLTFDL